MPTDPKRPGGPGEQQRDPRRDQNQPGRQPMPGQGDKTKN